MPPVGLEPTIPASALPQTYALDRAAATFGQEIWYEPIIEAGTSRKRVTMIKPTPRYSYN
jgi:hypothetical protein